LPDHDRRLAADQKIETPLDPDPRLVRRANHHSAGFANAFRTGHKVDVRVITATNVDVQSAIKDSDLREDLHYRLKVGVCHLPPQRQRRSDIPRLALFFLDRFNCAQGKSKRFSTEAMTWLRQQLWPGNIRELQNTIDSAALFAASDLIEVPDLDAAAESPKSAVTEIPEPTEGFAGGGYPFGRDSGLRAGRWPDERRPSFFLRA
jgi:DNA-binding NtrC family response regulator